MIHLDGECCDVWAALVPCTRKLAVRRQATISKYLPPKPRRPPSPTWRTFWNNHRSLIAAVNFFIVPTATFRLLYCFLVLTPDRRRVAHFNVTSHPSALWTALQIVEAFPFGAAPKYLVRDYDGIYGNAFQERMKHLGIEEVRITPRSPWHNPYVERLIGTIRRPLVSLRLTQPVRVGLQKPVERLFHVRPHHLADMTPKLRLLNTNNAVKASLIRKTCYSLHGTPSVKVSCSVENILTAGRLSRKKVGHEEDVAA